MTTIRSAYSMWPQYNRRLRDVVAAMTDDQLAIRPAPDLLPIWATVGHTAAMRVYWLCEVVGELGEALDSTFRIVEGCLDRWTPDMLDDEIQRDYAGTVQMHTRASILQRLLTHEAYHCGELSQTLGIHGLPQIDLWRPD